MFETEKRKWVIHISVILIVLVFIGLFVISSFKSCQSNFKYYIDISNYEWIELEHYSGKPKEYLGKYPNNIFCNIYGLEGIDENELLYLNGSGMIGFGSNEYTKIIMNDEFEEPIKRFPIKEIVITNSESSTIKIEDVTILNQIERVLKEQTGNTYSSFLSGKFNTTVYFDVSCDLSWSCVFEKRTDNSIHLIGYDQKQQEFRDYDVTDIFDDSGIDF